MTRLLLDTCAVIWTGTNDAISQAATDCLDECFDNAEPSYVSPITAWELGLLAARGRFRAALDVTAWFHTYMSRSAFQLSELTPEILIASSQLPGSPPKDPADRILLASARAFGMTIMTRDRHILEYARAGHVLAIEC